jgi:hypothetical protein
MPQITVTVDDKTYWELRQVAKGRLSAFVNRACAYAIGHCELEPLAYVAYAQGGLTASREMLKTIDDVNNGVQTTLTQTPTQKAMRRDNQKLKDGTFFKGDDEE